MTKQKLSERDEEIVRMRQAGLPREAVADEMNVSVGTVRNVEIAAGIAQPREAGSPEILSDSVEQVIEKYNSGARVFDILREHNLTYTRLYKLLADNNVPVRKIANADARERQLDEAVAMYEQGVRIVEITSETGVNQPTLHAELHARGVELRRPRK